MKSTCNVENAARDRQYFREPHKFGGGAGGRTLQVTRGNSGTAGKEETTMTKVTIGEKLWNHFKQKLYECPVDVQWMCLAANS